MIQTTKGKIRFPDGARFVLKNLTTGELLDAGAVSGAMNFVLNYDISEVVTGNYGTLKKRARNMKMAGSLSLLNWDAEVLAAMGSGMITRYVTEAGTIATIDDQTIAAGWENLAHIGLEMRETDGAPLIATAAPTIASVTASTSGVLAANDDYYIVADDNSASGYAIYFDTTGTATVATTESIVIAYTSVAAQAGETLYAGDTTEVLSGFGVIVQHKTDAGTIDYQLELFNSSMDSGGFQFNVKGANEDGVDEIPLSFTADIDTAREVGEQLFRVYMV